MNNSQHRNLIALTETRPGKPSPLWLLVGVILAFLLPFAVQRIVNGGSDSLTLSDTEYHAVEESISARDAYRKRFDQAASAALNAPLKCDTSLGALSEYQTSFALKLAAEARFEATLATHRLAHSCPECDYDPTFRSLIHPAAKK